mgnify:CR=1 FL=1
MDKPLNGCKNLLIHLTKENKATTKKIQIETKIKVIRMQMDAYKEAHKSQLELSVVLKYSDERKNELNKNLNETLEMLEREITALKEEIGLV